MDTKEAMYHLDECCKRVIRRPEVTARFLKVVVKEFSTLSVSEIIKYLPLEDDLVKLDDGDEKKYRCDLVFTCHLPNGYERRVIRINIEVQNSLPGGRNLPNRALIYSSGLIAKENAETIRKQEYEKLTKTVSIWFCPSATRDRIERVNFESEDKESYFGEDVYDLIKVGFIFMKRKSSDKTIDKRIANNDEGIEEALSCIWALFSTEYKKEEKEKVLREKYNLSIEAINEGEAMCNYSQMVLDKGLSQGRLNGLHEAYIKMYLSSILSLDRAAKECDVSKEKFISLVEDYKKDGRLNNQL